MAIEYKAGDTAYIAESAYAVRKVLIHNISGDFCTLRFTDTNGGIRVRTSRLFPTQEAAEATLKINKRRHPHPHLDEVKYIKSKRYE